MKNIRFNKQTEPLSGRETLGTGLVLAKFAKSKAWSLSCVPPKKYMSNVALHFVDFLFLILLK